MCDAGCKAKFVGDKARGVPFNFIFAAIAETMMSTIKAGRPVHEALKWANEHLDIAFAIYYGPPVNDEMKYWPIDVTSSLN